MSMVLCARPLRLKDAATRASQASPKVVLICFNFVFFKIWQGADGNAVRCPVFEIACSVLVLEGRPF